MTTIGSPSGARSIGSRLAKRQVVYLRYRSDLSFDQIGEALGITASAARSHATQAMATLRRRLGDEAER